MILPIVPGYRLVRELGAGRCATVYEAKSSRGETVALKRLRADDAEREIAASMYLEASHYVALPVDEIIIDNEIAFVPMPLFERHVRDLGPKGLLPSTFARFVALPIAKLIRDCERAGLVLTDLNPNNLMIRQATVQLIDLGSAILPGAFEDIEYTPTWYPPELPSGSVSVATLSWAFGAFGRWAAGLYWHRPDVETSEVIQGAPWLGATLAQLISECTKADPTRRPRPIEIEGRFASLLRESPRHCGVGHACFSDARSCACGIRL